MSNFVEFKHKGILINVTKSYCDEGRDIYTAAQFAWHLDKEKASEYPLVFAMVDYIIREVFVVDEWLDATAENFPEFQSLFGDEEKAKKLEGRIAFKGKLADNDIRFAYIGKEVPEKYQKNKIPADMSHHKQK